MRTLIDLDSSQVEALDAIAKQNRCSRAALIREAVDEYLARRSSAAGDDAFGLWRDRKVGGLVYEQRLRRDW